ncbi:SagB/ThcOx family dehydrogenase [Candidatus Auribacterota bacterium]
MSRSNFPVILSRFVFFLTVFTFFLCSESYSQENERDGASMNIFPKYQEASKLGYSIFSNTAMRKDVSPRGEEGNVYSVQKEIPLSEDITLGRKLLENVIKSRKEVKSFSGDGISFNDLSSILFFGDGVTYSRDYGFKKFGFRAAPSAGALYPTEMYVAVMNVSGLEKGIYRYDVEENDLELLNKGDFSRQLSAISFNGYLEDFDAVMIVTSVPYKSTARYRLRGYRYCYLDAGHIEANMDIAAESLGIGTKVAGGFIDKALKDLLGIKGKEEFPVFMYFVGKVKEWGSPDPSGKMKKPVQKDNAVSEGSKDLDLGKQLEGSIMDSSGSFKGNRYAGKPDLSVPVRSYETVKLNPPDYMKGRPAGDVIYGRRSKRDFWAQAIEADDLSYVLKYSAGTIKGGELAYSSISNIYPLEVYVIVNNVKGIQRGVYYYDPKIHQLYVVKQGDYRTRITEASLGQNFCGTSAFDVMIVVDLERAAAYYGDRGYRYALVDAGCLGEHVYLCAGSLGLGACGVGAFFDDPVNEIIGVDGKKRTVIYFVAVGRLRVEMKLGASK